MRYKDMKIFLTGATGLLGRNVLHELLNRGHDVVALVRNPQQLRLPAGVDSTRLNITKGSILDVATLRGVADGCGAIINCAGTTDMSLLRYADYLAVNKELVEHLLQLMDELGIQRLVHISTANTIGNGTPDKPGDEENDISAPFNKSFYAQSKLEAEKMLAWVAQEHPERHIVVLNPGFMVGPYDTHPSSGKLLLAAYKRRLMVTPKGGKSFVDVRDVATATVNALTMGRNGERYLLTGHDMSLKDFYALQAEQCGYKQQLLSLPNWLVNAAGYLGDLIRYLNIRTQLSTRNVRQLEVMEYYSNEKARKELAFPQTPLSTSIKDFFKWYNSI